MNFLIVYSTTNNKPWHSPNWRQFAEKDNLEAARKVFENLKARAEEGNTDCWPYFGNITQVAVFVERGRQTFVRKPRLYADYRDKSDWPIGAASAGLINSVNSDFTLNK